MHWLPMSKEKQNLAGVFQTTNEPTNVNIQILICPQNPLVLYLRSPLFGFWDVQDSSLI